MATAEDQARMRTLDYRRRYYKGQMTTLETYLNANASKLDVYDFTSRLSAMQEWKKSFDQIQTELEQLDVKEFETTERTEYEDRYIFNEATMRRMIHNLETQNAPSSLNMSSSADGNTIHTEVNLVRSDIPDIDLPKFSGEYLDWMSFINTFDVLVHNSTARNMNEVRKLSYLKNSVKGSCAEGIIGHLDLIPGNYKLARDLLANRFDKKRLIFESYIKRLMDIPNCANSSGLRSLTDRSVPSLAALDGVSNKEQQANGVIIALILQKVDKGTLNKWEEHSASRANELPDWTDFVEFLNKRCDTVAHVEHASKSQSSSASNTRKTYVGSASSCLICDGGCRTIEKCPTFLMMSPRKRSEKIKGQNVCIRCLNSLPTNGEHNCEVTCTVDACGMAHHNLLHYRKSKVQKKNSKDTPPASTTSTNIAAMQINKVDEQNVNKETVSTLTVAVSDKLTAVENGTKEISADFDFSSSYQILATAIITVFDENGKSRPLRTLIDGGSQLNLVRQKAIFNLILKSERISVGLTGINGTTSTLTRLVEIKFGTSDGMCLGVLRAAVIARIDGKHPSIPLDRTSMNIPANLKLADDEFHLPKEIDMIIGVDLAYTLLCVGQLRQNMESPILQKSSLGWLVAGTVPIAYSHAGNLNPSSFIASTEEILRRFWEIDELKGVKPIWSEGQLQCEAMYKETVTRSEDGKFVVELPFKRDPAALGDSYYVAKRYLLSLERLCQRKPEVGKLLYEFMDEYERLGHMTEIELEPNVKYNFIPHHPVLKEASTTTKLREVFNASAPTSTGISINDCLEVGPKIQPDLFEILIRFRSFKIAISGDIEKMYRQIWIAPHQRHLQCILWKRPGAEKISTFMLNTITYGFVCGAYLAIRSVHELAYTDKKFPLARDVLLRDFYVDDCLTGADSIDEAKDLYSQISQLLESAGMHMRKWCSNSDALLEDIPLEDREDLVRIGEDEFTKTLGLKWNTKSDQFHFTPQNVAMSATWTLRTVVSAMARIFDPLGLVCPVVVKMKILIQRLWTLKLHWDESLPLAENTMWCNLMEEVAELHKIRVPRYVGGEMSDTNKYELHAFSDASLKAYGCVAYIRVVSSKIDVRMVAAKARVTPLKKKTLARLELLGAMSMVDLQIVLRKTLPFKFESVHLWIDSMVVKTWVTSSPHRYDMWVANRVSDVQSKAPDVIYHHIPGDLNPADIVSRGANPVQLMNTKEWLDGPEFLYNHDYLPKSSESIDASDPRLEIVKKKFTLVSPIIKDPVTMVAAQGKLLTVKIFFYLFRRYFDCKIGRKVPTLARDQKLTAEQLDDGLLYAVRIVQMAHFFDVLECHRNKSALPAKHTLMPLRPFVDEQGLIRVGGRLSNAPISNDAKHPFLLPKKHAISDLLIKHYHETNCHAGPHATMAFIRQRFWILSGMARCNAFIRSCTTCRRSRPITFKQIMGDLPADRVTFTRPFTVSGIDLFGPFQLKQRGRGNRPYKIYVALFICFSSKAVHLEIVEDLSTAALINALIRFTSRRGVPHTIWSDNATNLRGADDLLKHVDWTQINHWCQKNRQITWKFIPARSPHFGGLWESGVKLAKTALLKVLKDDALFHEEMETLLAMVEATLNSRPLTPLTTNPTDDCPMTPGHLLIGQPLNQLPEPKLIDPGKQHASMTRSWKHLCDIREYWFERYSKQLISQLQNRYKWNSTVTPVKLDTVVLMVDRTLSAWKWMYGRISKLFPGKDGFIRAVEVTTPNGTTYRRAIQELVPFCD